MINQNENFWQQLQRFPELSWKKQALSLFDGRIDLKSDSETISYRNDLIWIL